MTDKATIGNMALGHIRAKTIASFEEVSVAGNYVRTYYDLARQQTLEGFNWGFARRRRALSLLVEAPASYWAYKYSLPSDCIKMREIEDVVRRSTDPIPFDVLLNDAGTSKTLVTNQADAVGIYTADIVNPNLFSPWMIVSMSWLLASYLSVPMAGRPEDEKRCFEWWQFSLSVAEANDANEQQDDPEPDGKFVQSRA